MTETLEGVMGMGFEQRLKSGLKRCQMDRRLDEEKSQDRVNPTIRTSGGK